MTLPALNPAQLFDVRGKSAIIVGATGAFGKVACTTLGLSGARLTIAAGKNAAELTTLARDLAEAGIEAHEIARRPNDEAGAVAIVEAAVAAYSGVEILVVASGMNDVAPVVDMAAERFTRGDAGQCRWCVAHRASGRASDDCTKPGRQGRFHFFARGKLGHPAGYSAYCASKALLTD